MRSPCYDRILRGCIVWVNGPYPPGALRDSLDLFLRRRWTGWFLMPKKPHHAHYRRALWRCSKYKELPAGHRHFRPASLGHQLSNGPCPFACTAFYIKGRKKKPSR